MQTIIISVSGGAAHIAFIPKGSRVVIVDWDNVGDNGGSPTVDITNGRSSRFDKKKLNDDELWNVLQNNKIKL